MSMKIQNVIICISKLSRPHMAEKFIGKGQNGIHNFEIHLYNLIESILVLWCDL